jgi:hypothetical protein
MSHSANHHRTTTRLRGRLDPLGIAAIVFVVANVLHTLDHERQGTARLTTEIYIGGVFVSLIALGALYFTLTRHAKAPLVAAVVGLWTAAGVAASHLAPHWSALSDPYPSLSLDALSWAIMLFELATALVLGLMGLARLRAERAAPAFT